MKKGLWQSFYSISSIVIPSKVDILSLNSRRALYKNKFQDITAINTADISNTQAAFTYFLKESFLER